LERIGEEFGVDINYDPKPIKGDWSGSGAHFNYSDIYTRGEQGYEYIVKTLIPLLEKSH
jgi:glutamine synthetase